MLSNYVSTEGDDYWGLNQTLTFRSDLSPEMCVSVLVYEDVLVEDNEQFLLVLTTNDPAVLLVEPNVTEIIIINTDGIYMFVKIVTLHASNFVPMCNILSVFVLIKKIICGYLNFPIKNRP